jgi:hypothetical protein
MASFCFITLSERGLLSDPARLMDAEGDFKDIDTGVSFKVFRPLRVMTGPISACETCPRLTAIRSQCLEASGEQR